MSQARHVIRIREKFNAAKEDISAKNISISDSEKRFNEAIHRLKSFAAMYDVAKNERNKYVGIFW